MNPIGLIEIGEVDGLRDLEPSDLAAVTPASCAARGEERRRGDRVMARCIALHTRLGWSVSVSPLVCRRCLCHGGPDPATNPYLKCVTLQAAHSRTVHTPEGKAQGMDPPSDDNLSAAIMAVKVLAGESVAVRLIDAMFYFSMVDADKAAQLIVEGGLSGASTE
jgi:hypothetical protein